MFKNMVVYKMLETPFDRQAADLEALLSQRPLEAPTGSSPSSSGWLPFHDGSLVYSVDRNLFCLLGIESKVVPAAAVNRELAIRCAEFESQRGHKPGRKLKRELREQILSEFLPRALTSLAVIPCWIDVQNQMLIVDSSSPKKAEILIDHLRDALESLPLEPLNTQNDPVMEMTNWLLDAPMKGYIVGNTLELLGEEKSKVKFTKMTVEDSDEVKAYIGSGMRPSMLSLFSDDGSLEFTVTSSLTFKGLKIDAGETQEEQGDDPEMAFEAGARIFVDAARTVISDVTKAMGGTVEG